jgi:protein ImuA
MPIATSRAFDALRAAIEKIEASGRAPKGVLPFGLEVLDQRLPGGGLALGALHEVAGGGNGAIDGTASALFAAGLAARTRGQVLWCVTRKDLFAPSLAQAGLAADRVIYVEATDEKSVLACFEEGLRHGGLGAVVGEVARLSMTASRRLQLCAEGSGTIGHRGSPLAPPGRGGRFRAAHGRRHPLAGDRPALLPTAGRRRRPTPMVR